MSTPRARKLALPSAPRPPFVVNSLAPVYAPVIPRPGPTAPNSASTPALTSTSTPRDVKSSLPSQESPSSPQRMPGTMFPQSCVPDTPGPVVDARRVATDISKPSVRPDHSSGTMTAPTPVVHRKLFDATAPYGNVHPIERSRATMNPTQSIPHATFTPTPSAHNAAYMYPSPAASSLPSLSSSSSPPASGNRVQEEARYALKRRASDDSEGSSGYKRIRFAAEGPKPPAKAPRKKNPLKRDTTSQATGSTSQAAATIDHPPVQTSTASTSATLTPATHAPSTVGAASGNYVAPTPGPSKVPYTGPSQAPLSTRKRKREGTRGSDSESPLQMMIKALKNPAGARNKKIPRPQRLPTPPPPAEEIIELSTDTFPMPAPPPEDMVPYNYGTEDSFSPPHDWETLPSDSGFSLQRELFEETGQDNDGRTTHTYGQQRSLTASEGPGGSSVYYSQSVSVTVREPSYGSGHYAPPARKRHGQVQNKKIGLPNMTRSQKNAVGTLIMDATQSPESLNNAIDAAFSPPSYRPAIAGVPLNLTQEPITYGYSYLAPHPIALGNYEPEMHAPGYTDQRGHGGVYNNAPGPSTSGVQHNYRGHFPPPVAYPYGYIQSTTYAQAYGSRHDDEPRSTYAQPAAGPSTYAASPGRREYHSQHTQFINEDDYPEYAQPQAGTSSYATEDPSSAYSHDSPVYRSVEYYREPDPMLDDYGNQMSPTFNSREVTYEYNPPLLLGEDQLVRHYSSFVKRASDGQKAYHYSTAVMPSGFLQEPQPEYRIPSFESKADAAERMPPPQEKLEDTILRVLGS
ncbi:hypothetical protein AURDEDRAFT_121677 [Auricularia subglabra TFB-10046 SS5]|nr:hypothetical protein AURDEDRAFT_121677 [Auricularia subglabra TFB-10046 SS5]